MGSPSPEPEYLPFPDEDGRNWRQVHLEIPAMCRALGLPRGGRVLEVGCGRGTGLAPLARALAPRRLVGSDIDPTLIDIARARLTGIDVELEVADVRALPHPDGAFDLVIDFGTCFHVARRIDALREIARVLVPRGLFVTETRLSQLLSHPVRSGGRALPWTAVPELPRRRHAVLWESRMRRLADGRP